MDPQNLAFDTTEWDYFLSINTIKASVKQSRLNIELRICHQGILMLSVVTLGVGIGSPFLRRGRISEDELTTL